MTDKHQPPKKSLLYNAIIILLVIMFLNAFVFPLFTQPRVTEVTYDKFLSMLDSGEVREVALDDTSSTILFLAEVEGRGGHLPHRRLAGRRSDPAPAFPSRSLL